LGNFTENYGFRRTPKSKTAFYAATNQAKSKATYQHEASVHVGKSEWQKNKKSKGNPDSSPLCAMQNQASALVRAFVA